MATYHSLVPIGTGGFPGNVRTSHRNEHVSIWVVVLSDHPCGQHGLLSTRHIGRTGGLVQVSEFLKMEVHHGIVFLYPGHGLVGHSIVGLPLRHIPVGVI